MDLGGAGGLVTASAALVTAVSLALVRLSRSRLLALEVAFAELRTQMAEAKADAAEARRIAEEIQQARATDRLNHESELRSRDRLIAAHMAWDHKAIARIVTCDPAHDLGDPPPLFPGLVP